MKKLLIILLVLAILAGTGWYFREPIIDLLPIDQSGWEEKDGSRFYLNEKGDPLTGWQQIGGGTYYFSETGALQTGWLEDGGERYYLTSPAPPSPAGIPFRVPSTVSTKKAG